jgi:hypothetical protein
MTLERFSELSAAYGADIARWPQSERAAAQAFAASEPALADAALAAERELDAGLDAWRAAEAPAGLRNRIIAAAPRERAVAARFRRWIATAGLGIGLVAAGLSGVAAGMALAPPELTRFIAAPASNAAAPESVLADPAGDASEG